MQNQEDLMEREHTPLIDIDYLLPKSASSAGVSENSLVVELLNVGNGVAIDPQVYIFTEFDEETIETPEVHFPLIRKSDRKSREDAGYGELSTALPADSNGKLYETNLQIGVRKSSQEKIKSMHFHKALKYLYEQGVETLKLEMGVQVFDIDNNVHEFEVLNCDVNLSHVVSGPLGPKPNKEINDDFSAEKLSFTRVFRYVTAERGGKIVDGDGENGPWTNKMDEIAVQILDHAIDEISNNEEDFSEFLEKSDFPKS